MVPPVGVTVTHDVLAVAVHSRVINDLFPNEMDCADGVAPPVVAENERLVGV
jgi:hypothetical protein